MIKKTIVSIATFSALLMGSSSSTLADDKKFYAGINLHAIIVQDADWTNDAGSTGSWDYGTSYGIGAALGYYVPNSDFRTELEYTYRDLELDSSITDGVPSGGGDLDGHSFMVNGYYDFKPVYKFRPYIGVGVGATHIRSTQAGASLSETSFAYQGMLGAAYDVNDANTVNFGYRYHGTRDISYFDGLGNRSVDGLDVHALEIGYRFSF